jgi:hypothetical protein
VPAYRAGEIDADADAEANADSRLTLGSLESAHKVKDLVVLLGPSEVVSGAHTSAVGVSSGVDMVVGVAG